MAVPFLVPFWANKKEQIKTIEALHKITNAKRA
jgi:hypothetical protein